MCWQQLPGLIVTGRSTIGADPCGLLSAPIAKLSSHSWGNTRSRSHDGLGAGIRDAWMGGQKEVGIVAWNWTPPDSRPLDNPLRSDQNWHRRTKGEYRLGQWPQPF